MGYFWYMNYEIQAEEDSNFKINVVKFGEKHMASNGENVAIEATPEEAIEKVVEQSTPQPVKVDNGPKPVPIENHRSTGMSWFEGTSWSTKQ